MIGFALKRSAYQLNDFDKCIQMLSDLFLDFDSILLDYEGIQWEFSIAELLRLEEFLATLDTKKRLIYTIGVRANEWDLDTEIGSVRGKQLVKQSQRCKQLFFCLSIGHKAYLTEQEKQKSSRKTIIKYVNFLKEFNYQKCWYLAGDKIIRLANSILNEFSNVSIILLQSATVFHEIAMLKDINLSKIGIYGLWIEDTIDQHAKQYLERRGVKNVDINTVEVKEYILTMSKLNTSEYQNIGYVFLFSSALKEDREPS